MTTGVRKTGDFCWINILTPDPAAAREFFGKLLDWKFSDLDGMGDLIEAGGGDIGAMFDLNGPNSPPGLPPVIGVMVKVDNADEMVERVNSLGGKAKPAFDIMENGRMGECEDPTGAKFDLWQPKKQAAATADTTRHGATSWFEELTTDVGRATKFYAELFGWTPEVMHMPGMDYTTFKLGDTMIAGMMPVTADMGKVPPHWGTYFTVDDPDEAARKVEELGGTVFVPPTDIPDVGRFCGIQSPQGVRFYVIKYAR
ncbi:MAG: VOC family protein [Gemmatimonadales bacterium]